MFIVRFPPYSHSANFYFSLPQSIGLPPHRSDTRPRAQSSIFVYGRPRQLPLSLIGPLFAISSRHMVRASSHSFLHSSSSFSLQPLALGLGSGFNRFPSLSMSASAGPPFTLPSTARYGANLNQGASLASQLARPNAASSCAM